MGRVPGDPRGLRRHRRPRRRFGPLSRPWAGSGIEVDAVFHEVYTLRDGKIVRYDEFTERSEALEAAGPSEWARREEGGGGGEIGGGGRRGEGRNEWREGRGILVAEGPFGRGSGVL